ncbi:sugar porter family MFS transporter [Belliella sp. DSM 111904]|uniref:Sugar porter family MFS transporter n=1 Tax=Belliella filtrata TaxID=2923435 RepID=A0ABS9UY69_9BACT|nr:sugar porter family MFS transporter [Belliella filtrata]MCH7409094.1 sugar porter family MFS transporter [Belliella filtrata]
MERRLYIGKITFISSLGGLLFGFDMAVISGVLPFVQTQFDLSPSQEGWFVSSALLGAVMGVGLSGELCDRFGRRSLLFIAAILFLLSAIVSTVLPTFTLLIIARILGGIGVGMASNAVPLYLSEIAPLKIRGRLVTCYQLAITFGILLAYLTNSGMLKLSGSFSDSSINESYLGYIFKDEVWRGMFSVEIIPATLFLIGLVLVPESPRWLLQQGRVKEAIATFSKLKDGSEMKQDLEELDVQKNDGINAYKTLFSKRLRRPLLIGVLLPLFSQFSGINAIIYYGPSILKDAGVSLNNALIGQIVLGTVNMLFTFIAVWKVDSLGRRPLYLVGSMCASISLFVTGYCFYEGMTQSLLLLLSATIFLASFAFSIGPLKFVIASEIFPDAIRGRALALSIMVMWIADTIVGQLTPIMFSTLGTSGAFWVFASFCLIAFIVVSKMVSETKGKSLEEIQEIYVDHKDENT